MVRSQLACCWVGVKRSDTAVRSKLTQKVMNGGVVQGTEGDDGGGRDLCVFGRRQRRARDSKRETTRDLKWRDHTKKSQKRSPAKASDVQ